MELSAQLELVDWAVLAGYFIILAAVGIWVLYINYCVSTVVFNYTIDSNNFISFFLFSLRVAIVEVLAAIFLEDEACTGFQYDEQY